VRIELGARHGSYTPGYRTVELDVRGVQAPGTVLVDGVATSDWQHDAGRLVLRVPATNAAQQIELRGVLR